MQSEFEKTFKQHRDALTTYLTNLGKQRQVQAAEWDIEQNKSDYEFYFTAGWQAAKAQSVSEGFVVVNQKDLLELTIAINAVDLATHTESKTNEVREMWQRVALKLMALGTTQEPK